MTLELIEKEVTALKARVKQLEAKARRPAGGGWRSVIGMLKDDEMSREAARLGAEWRARENKRR